MIAASASWTGSYALPASATPVAIVVQAYGTTATVSLGPGHSGATSVTFVVKGARVRFAFPGLPQNVAFAGVVKGSRLVGHRDAGEAARDVHSSSRALAPPTAPRGLPQRHRRRGRDRASAWRAGRPRRAPVRSGARDRRDPHGRRPARRHERRRCDCSGRDRLHLERHALRTHAASAARGAHRCRCRDADASGGTRAVRRCRDGARLWTGHPRRVRRFHDGTGSRRCRRPCRRQAWHRGIG